MTICPTCGRLVTQVEFTTAVEEVVDELGVGRFPYVECRPGHQVTTLHPCRHKMPAGYRFAWTRNCDTPTIERVR